jgi:hypothetical protein
MCAVACCRQQQRRVLPAACRWDVRRCRMQHARHTGLCLCRQLLGACAPQTQSRMARAPLLQVTAKLAPTAAGKLAGRALLTSNALAEPLALDASAEVVAGGLAVVDAGGQPLQLVSSWAGGHSACEWHEQQLAPPAAGWTMHHDRPRPAGCCVPCRLILGPPCWASQPPCSWAWSTAARSLRTTTCPSARQPTWEQLPTARRTAAAAGRTPASSRWPA